MCNRYLSLTAMPLYLHPPQLAPAICGYKVCVGAGGGVGWGRREKGERGLGGKEGRGQSRAFLSRSSPFLHFFNTQARKLPSFISVPGASV